MVNGTLLNFGKIYKVNYKLVHVHFVGQFCTLLWDEVTIIHLPFSFRQVKKKEQIAVDYS